MPLTHWTSIIGTSLFILYLLYPEFFLRGRRYENELTHFLESRPKEIGVRVRGFYLVEDKKLNCYTLPGRKVFFTRGLIENMEKEQVLAIVLHEIGHIKRRHLLYRIPVITTYAYILVLPLAFALALLHTHPVLSAGLFLLWIGWYLLLKRMVSRRLSKKLMDQEFEADGYAMENYKGDALAGGLQILKDKARTTNSLIFKFISLTWKFIMGPYPTHPPIEERIARLKQ